MSANEPIACLTSRAATKMAWHAQLEARMKAGTSDSAIADDSEADDIKHPKGPVHNRERVQADARAAPLIRPSRLKASRPQSPAPSPGATAKAPPARSTLVRPALARPASARSSLSRSRLKVVTFALPPSPGVGTPAAA